MDSQIVDDIIPPVKKARKTLKKSVRMEWSISSQARCTHCKKFILKGTRRIRKTKFERTRRATYVYYYHESCYIDFVDNDTSKITDFTHKSLNQSDTTEYIFS